MYILYMIKKFSVIVGASLAVVLLIGTGCVRTTSVDMDTLPTQEIELNTPYRDDMAEQKRRLELLNTSYLFVVENKQNDFGKNSDYGILAVGIDCRHFTPISLAQKQVIDLAEYKNKSIVLQDYEYYQGEYVLKLIEEDRAHTKEIEALKKTCTEPFKRYMQ
jgi:hypothetical protein